MHKNKHCGLFISSPQTKARAYSALLSAERERFELSVRFPPRHISSVVPSTTQPPLHLLNNKQNNTFLIF